MPGNNTCKTKWKIYSVDDYGKSYDPWTLPFQALAITCRTRRFNVISVKRNEKNQTGKQKLRRYDELRHIIKRPLGTVTLLVNYRKASFLIFTHLSVSYHINNTENLMVKISDISVMRSKVYKSNQKYVSLVFNYPETTKMM